MRISFPRFCRQFPGARDAGSLRQDFESQLRGVRSDAHIEGQKSQIWNSGLGDQSARDVQCIESPYRFNRKWKARAIDDGCSKSHNVPVFRCFHEAALAKPCSSFGNFSKGSGANDNAAAFH